MTDPTATPSAATQPREVALITGASRGIGKAIALSLARAGATVYGTATRAAGAAGISEILAAYGREGCVLHVRAAASGERHLSTTRAKAPDKERVCQDVQSSRVC